jgi:hypothetical protein
MLPPTEARDEVAASPPWVDSDTVYAAAPTGPFYNVRTGVISTEPPSGLRANGERRKSAPTCGAWALPFASPPQLLPAELIPAAPAAGVCNPGMMLTPDVERWGARTLLFTAPHGINLARDEKPEHLPEDFTTYLARAWAAHTGGVSVSWGGAALQWSDEFEQPLPGARDPNYLTEQEAAANVWVVALGALSTGRGMHVDVHGKADRAGECDCDVGVGALRAEHGDSAADAFADAVSGALRRALAPEFSVDSRPRLQGRWRSVPRRTLTQSSARLGFWPLQLEVGYALRRALGRDRALCARVADAVLACASTCASPSSTS